MALSFGTAERGARWLSWSALVRHALYVVAVYGPGAEPGEPERGEPRRPREGRAWLDELERDFPAGDGDPLHSEAAFNAVVQKRVSDWGSAWSPKAWVRIEAAFRELRRLSDVLDHCHHTSPGQEKTAEWIHAFLREQLAAEPRADGP